MIHISDSTPSAGCLGHSGHTGHTAVTLVNTFFAWSHFSWESRLSTEVIKIGHKIRPILGESWVCVMAGIGRLELSTIAD